LLDAARLAGVKRVVNFSSEVLYGAVNGAVTTVKWFVFKLCGRGFEPPSLTEKTQIIPIHILHLCIPQLQVSRIAH
jgi:nucleoside-diphosphate-sugar epimerase